jgi:hypothetical protein
MFEVQVQARALWAGTPPVLSGFASALASPYLGLQVRVLLGFASALASPYLGLQVRVLLGFASALASPYLGLQVRVLLGFASALAGTWPGVFRNTYERRWRQPKAFSARILSASSLAQSH